MRWNPFSTKSRAPERNASDDPNARILKRFTRTGRPSATYNEVLEAQAAMCHIVAYRCLDKIATTMQGCTFYIERDPEVPKSFRTNAKTIERLEAVLASPNANMNGRQLRYWLALSYAAFGRIPLKVGVAASMRVPNGIYPLEAGLTEALYNNAGEIYAYKYGKDSDALTIPSLSKAERGRDEEGNSYPKGAFAHEIVKPGLTGFSTFANKRRNNTPLNAIGLPASIVTLLMQRAYDTASGHPNSKYIVATEKTLTEPQKDSLKEQFGDREVGEEESGNVLILGNTKVQVEKLDNNLADIHSKMPLDDMSRQIAGAFGIPVALLGFAGADGSKFANNFTESRVSFFEDTMIPGYIEPITGGLTECMCPEGYVVRADLDSIPALQDKRATRAKELVDIDFLTIDEKRELCGYGKHKPGTLPLPGKTPTSTQTPEPTSDPDGEPS